MSYMADRQVICEQPSTTIALDSTGDKKTFFIPFNCVVQRIGCTITTALTVTAVVIAFDRRPLPGSDTGRGDADVGTLTAPAAAQVVGRTLYDDVQVNLKGGEQVVVEVTTAASAGAGLPFLEITPRAEEPANDSEFISA